MEQTSARAASGNGTPPRPSRFDQRGWIRCGNAKTGFHYRNAKGETITSPAHLKRIKQLRIPPAWREVRISPKHHADLQASGYDSKGRKQYIYHPDYRARQAQKKFDRMLRFAKGLPRFRKITTRHLLLPGLPKEKVLAAVSRLINETYFRVGCERYAKEHRTFGASSLRKRHCKIQGKEIIINFRGKRAIIHRRVLTDELLSGIILELNQLPGTRLFQYLDESGQTHPINEGLLNQYLKEVFETDCSAKDFRTFGASMLAAQILSAQASPDSDKDCKKIITACVRQVARHLGNTPAVTRSAYIHPKIFELFQSGSTLANSTPRRRSRQAFSVQAGYTEEERAFLALIGMEALNTEAD